MSGDNKEIRFQGAGVSPGLARGVIHVVRDDLDDVPRYRIEPSQIPSEIARFEAALVQTRVQILEMQQKIAEAIGTKDAAIFDAHLLVVEDRTLIDEVLRKLESDLCNVEWIFQEVANNYAETLSKIDDPYLRERALDVQDVTRKLQTGAHVLVDGPHGLLIVDPKPETLAHYGEIESRRVKAAAQLRELRETKSIT